jgi:hypothetical protein
MPDNQLSIELTGTVIALDPPQAFGAKGFRKAQIVLEIENGNYPQKVPVEAAGKKADLFTEANVQTGDTVAIRANLNGREWNGRYFVGLSAWKCELIDGGQVRAPAVCENEAVQAAEAMFSAEDATDDILF